MYACRSAFSIDCTQGIMKASPAHTGCISSYQPAKEFYKLVASPHPVWIFPFPRQLPDIYPGEVEILTD